MVMTLMTSRGEQCPHEEGVVTLPPLPQVVVGEVALVMGEGEMGAVAGVWEETEVSVPTLMVIPISAEHSQIFCSIASAALSRAEVPPRAPESVKNQFSSLCPQKSSMEP